MHLLPFVDHSTSIDFGDHIGQNVNCVVALNSIYKNPIFDPIFVFNAQNGKMRL